MLDLIDLKAHQAEYKALNLQNKLSVLIKNFLPLFNCSQLPFFCYGNNQAYADLEAAQQDFNSTSHFLSLLRL